MILNMLGGLALFLYGMQMMSVNLEAAAGSRMKQILERLTVNRVLGVLVGAGITAIIQSSSATTVMVVGFVNSGLMTLRQAIWIIMGANIGTTITGQLIALDIGALAPLIAFAGVAIVLFVKDKKWQYFGGIIAGLGVLFIGMDIMGSAMEPLRESQTFIDLMTRFSNPLLGIAAGAIFTAIIQSSSASVGILQALAMSGVIGLDSAVFVLFGQNIGTCITAVLASIGANRNAKRTTVIHLMFNVIGTVLFVTICLLTPFTAWMQQMVPDSPAAQIANVHTVFNIVTTLVLLPFGTLLEKAAVKILPDRTETAEGKIGDYDRWLDSVMNSQKHLGASAMAVNQIRDDILKMLKEAEENVRAGFRALAENSTDELEEISQREESIDLWNVNISHKISKVLEVEQSPQGIAMLYDMFTVIGNVERIGDHAMNLAEYAQTMKERGQEFTGEWQHELVTMSDTCGNALEFLVESAGKEPGNMIPAAQGYEQLIDDTTRNYRNNQIQRLRDSGYSVEASIIYSEILTDYERIGDHILNIAEALTVQREKA